jgi:hypothetical protein
VISRPYAARMGVILNENNQDDFGSYEAVKRGLIIFNQQVELSRQAYAILLRQKIDYYDVLAPLLYSINDSCDSIMFLANKGKVRDCYILSRTIFETVVNFCFICTMGRETAEKAKRYVLQKSYRDLHRETETGKLKFLVKWQGEVNSSLVPGLDDAIKEFTSKKGREINEWTPENIQQKINVVEDKFGEKISGNLLFGLVAIYRHASEITHGSLFGALFSVGLTSPSERPKNPQNLAIIMGENIEMLLLMLFGALDSVLLVMATYLPLQEQIDNSKELFRKIKEGGLGIAQKK